MTEKLMDRRKERILAAVIQDYILSAEPVGSKTLVERYGLSISPATARGELAILEEMGYLTHPHTSAGRQPTELGYRYYVNTIVQRDDLTLVEGVEIAREYAALGNELEDLLQYTCGVLSKVTRCASVVFAPAWRKERLKHIDVVPLSGSRILLVIITDTGLVAKHSLTVSEPLEYQSWVKIQTALNAVGAGKTCDHLAQVGARAGQLCPELSGAESRMIQVVLTEVAAHMNSHSVGEVYSAGVANLLEYPELGVVDKVQHFLGVIEQGWQVLGMLSEMAESYKVWVSIGSENRGLMLEDCSLVATKYEVGGEAVGAVTILGPTRMDYARAIAAVELVAENLGGALESVAGGGRV